MGFVTLVVISGATARGKMNCEPPVATGRVDPIVARGTYPTEHQHVFFGNSHFGRLSPDRQSRVSYGDLVGQSTTCQNRADSALYWVPTLKNKNTGRVYDVVFFDAYYKDFRGRRTGPGAAIPKDTRLVAGFPNNTGKLPNTSVIQWRCGGETNRNGPYRSPVEAACHTAKLRGSGGRVRLTLNVRFPSCWDGRYGRRAASGNTLDNSHFAYPLGGSCPGSHPRRISRMSYSVGFDYAGSGRDVRLSSDAPGSVPGSSAHGDFWNTWVQSGQERMVRVCVNRGDDNRSPLCE